MMCRCCFLYLLSPTTTSTKETKWSALVRSFQTRSALKEAVCVVSYLLPQFLLSSLPTRQQSEYSLPASHHQARTFRPTVLMILYSTTDAVTFRRSWQVRTCLPWSGAPSSVSGPLLAMLLLLLWTISKKSISKNIKWKHYQVCFSVWDMLAKFFLFAPISFSFCLYWK